MTQVNDISIKSLLTIYQNAVINNPELVGRLETSAKILSYIIPVESAAVSELFSTIVGLIAICNDYILRKAANIKNPLPREIRHISRYLSVIEEVEVFLEIATLEGRSNILKWVVVASIQIVKIIFRLTLLLVYRVGITSNAQTYIIKRDKKLKDKLKRQKQNGDSFVMSLSDEEEESVEEAFQPTFLAPKYIFAESIYILRPLLHLFSLRMFGLNSWKPWLFAAALDVSSICVMGEVQNLNLGEKEEMKRRTIYMILYLLRSPFYDTYSKTKILLFLAFLSNKIPLMRHIIKPIMDYIPTWQKIYFYVWCN